ncbi:MAG: 4-hydroxythreonine-4-phosphate dehydrogenase PdxA [Planctomycetota bacterium]
MSAHTTGGAARPLIALTVGDPAGIGPETVAAALARPELRERMALLVIGPEALRPRTVPRLMGDAEAAPDLDAGLAGGSGPGHGAGADARARRPLPEAAVRAARAVADVAWLATPGPTQWSLGEVQASCGAAAVAALEAGHRYALAGAVDALVTAPVNKAALHLAGTRVEGQTELLARWCEVTRYEMIGMAGALRVMLLTRHMPLVAAIEAAREAALPGGLLERHVALFDEALRALVGIDRPRLAVAGLNPHAGEGGILGRDELERFAPAVARARASGFDVAGPVSPDAVFYEALQGRYDGVLALYHDQAFIPLKLLSNGRGVTVIAGLPYLRLSPMHGTAFDIAGQGLADPTNLIEALHRAADFVARRGGAAGLGSGGGAPGGALDGAPDSAPGGAPGGAPGSR